MTLAPRVLLVSLVTLVVSMEAGQADPLTEALHKAAERDALVVAVVGTDWLPESVLLEQRFVPALEGLPCERALIWAEDAGGRKLGLGISVLSPSGERLLRCEALDALDLDQNGIRALLETAARRRALDAPERRATLGPDERRELAQLAAASGAPDTVRAALGLANDAAASTEDNLLLAEAHWNADDNAACERILAAQAPETLALAGGLPRYWLAACRLSPPKDEAGARGAVGDLEALAHDASAGARARLLALDVIRQFAGGSPARLEQLSAIAEELAPASARSSRILFNLACASPDADRREAALRQLDRAPVGAALATLARARAAWPTIAERSLQSASACAPAARVVVIAPDERTFLRELARWDASARWPVLLADSWYCRLFLRAYAPDRVLLAAAGGGGDVASPAQAAAAALGPELLGGIAVSSAEETLLARTTDGAPGCVLLDPKGGLGCAAALLAAGHRQPLAAWTPAGRHADTASPAELAALREAAARALDGTGRAWRGLGDAIDFVTLASDLPYRCALTEGFEPGVRALDDALLRDPNGIPQAFVGRLAPDPVQAVYMANCALFLDRRRALLFDTYGSSPPWSDYALAPAAARLPELGFTEARAVPAGEASIGRWLHEQRAPFQWDQIAVNSSGGFRDWSCGTGGCSDDVTQVGPTFVSYVHSNAAGQPLDPDSIVGRWLTLGCYGFFGSVNEPYLESFRPSSEPVVALAEGWPAALAWRRRPGETYWCAWRLAMLGDPLCGLPCRRTDALPDLPLAPCDPERDLPAMTPIEQDALAGEWRALAEFALASAPATPRERALARSAFLTEMDRATEDSDPARACAMLRAWRALSGEDWALPRLAERLRPLLAGPPEARAALAECFRALAAEAADQNVQADLTKRAGEAAAAPGT